MAESRVTINLPHISHNSNLARGNAEILSWLILSNKKNKPAADDLGEDAVAGSNSENQSIHQDLSTCDEEQESGEGGISL